MVIPRKGEKQASGETSDKPNKRVLGLFSEELSLLILKDVLPCNIITPRLLYDFCLQIVRLSHTDPEREEIHVCLFSYFLHFYKQC